MGEKTDIGNFIRNKWDSISFGAKFAFIAFVDASFGLRNQSGILSILFNGDFLWITQFFEYVISSFFLLYCVLNSTRGWVRKVFLLLTPIFILLIFAFCQNIIMRGIVVPVEK